MQLLKKIIEFISKKKFPIEIQIIKDGDQILNTGGGILNMISSSSENDHIIFNPDTVWDERYVDRALRKRVKNVDDGQGNRRTPRVHASHL